MKSYGGVGCKIGEEVMKLERIKLLKYKVALDEEKQVMKGRINELREKL